MVAVAAGLPATVVRACHPATVPIAIDVGHHADDPGAISARGRPEFAFNLDLARVLLATLHERGFVRATLLPDLASIRTLEDRTAAATAMHARLFLSIHHDSVQERYLETWQPPGSDEASTYSRHASGHSLFVSRSHEAAEASLRLARWIGRALADAGFRYSPHHAEAIPGESRDLLDAELGIYRFDGLYVLRTSPVPAVLIEAGVIKHPEEELRLLDPAYQAAFAAAVAAGVERFCATP